MYWTATHIYLKDWQLLNENIQTTKGLNYIFLDYRHLLGTSTTTYKYGRKNKIVQIPLKRH